LVSSDFYATSIVPFAPIIIKICRAYTNTREDFEDYYQEVCLQIFALRKLVALISGQVASSCRGVIPAV
jgi:DNA-directed RNA polymerase specialized sigma24 family protein